MSRHYIAEISLNVTLNHKQQQLLPLSDRHQLVGFSATLGVRNKKLKVEMRAIILYSLRVRVKTWSKFSHFVNLSMIILRSNNNNNNTLFKEGNTFSI